MSLKMDAARPVREGEGLDLERLGRFLGEALGLDPGGLALSQFPSGHSNLTYLLQQGEREWVLRRPPVGAQVKRGHDMGREFRVLSKLWESGAVPVPKPVAMCDDLEVLGAPFYVMERLKGVVLRGTRALPGLDAARCRRLSEQLVDALAGLHGVDLVATGLGELGKPQGYIERQIVGWTERYRQAQTDELPELEEVAAWLASHTPPDGPPAFLHGDFKYDNVLWSQDLEQLVGVLDWEMAAVGDPRMDLGTSLGYWAEPADMERLGLLPFGPTVLPGNLDRREVVERYAAKTGLDLSGAVFYHAYGIFKIAVILQQIYARYAKGVTQDERFAMFIVGVKLLGEMAARAIEKDRIDNLWG
jgi:aminoglycoside phosphotransferase (APT) family kinase protein